MPRDLKAVRRSRFPSLASWRGACGGVFQEQENEPVGEHHKFNEKAGQPTGLQHAQDVCHGCIEGQEEEGRTRWRGLSGSAARPAALPPGSRSDRERPTGRAKASRGVREILTRMAPVPRSRNVRGRVMYLSQPLYRNTAPSHGQVRGGDKEEKGRRDGPADNAEYDRSQGKETFFPGVHIPQL